MNVQFQKQKQIKRFKFCMNDVKHQWDYLEDTIQSLQKQQGRRREVRAKIGQAGIESSKRSKWTPMFLIISKASGRQQYVPWTFRDMIGLADRLPVLTDGINKWITALEESTAGVTLAFGDIKALLMHIAGKLTTEKILMNAV